MFLHLLKRVLVAAAILPVTTVYASPAYALDARNSFQVHARDVYLPLTCDNLVSGATKILIGNVCVSISSGTLTVLYTLSMGYTHNAVHVLVNTTVPTVTAPGQFAYSSDKGTPPLCTISPDKSTATCIIPVLPEWRGCGKTLYIATHDDVNGPDLIQQTAWGNGTCYDNKGNCAKYWTVVEDCSCALEIDFFPITYTTTSFTTITGSSTSTYLTSTTITYETSSTSTYTTSTTVTYLTSTTSEYTAIGSSTSTSTSSSIYPLTTTFPATTTTTTCLNSLATTITTTVSTTLPVTS